MDAEFENLTDWRSAIHGLAVATWWGMLVWETFLAERARKMALTMTQEVELRARVGSRAAQLAVACAFIVAFTLMRPFLVVHGLGFLPALPPRVQLQSLGVLVASLVAIVDALLLQPRTVDAVLEVRRLERDDGASAVLRKDATTRRDTLSQLRTVASVACLLGLAVHIVVLARHGLPSA